MKENVQSHLLYQMSRIELLKMRMKLVLKYFLRMINSKKHWRWQFDVLFAMHFWYSSPFLCDQPQLLPFCDFRVGQPKNFVPKLALFSFRARTVGKIVTFAERYIEQKLCVFDEIVTFCFERRHFNSFYIFHQTLISIIIIQNSFLNCFQFYARDWCGFPNWNYCLCYS